MNLTVIQATTRANNTKRTTTKATKIKSKVPSLSKSL